jgi:hypothetical protein
LETVVEGSEVLGATPSDTIEAIITKTKYVSSLAKVNTVFPTTVEVMPPPVGTSTINNSPADVATANDVIEGVSQLAQPVASYNIPPDNLYESTRQISDSIPDKGGDLKNDEDFEQGDPWDKFSSSESKGQYSAVAAGKNENSFGIYADLRKF